MKTLITCLAFVATIWLPGDILAQSVVTVSGDASDNADYATLNAALSHITNASATNPYEILVYPGTYTGCGNGGAIYWKSYVSLRGVDRKNTIIRGSCEFPNNVQALIDFEDTAGVEVSNITIDGSAQMALGENNENGALVLCGATITLDHVTLLAGSASYAPGYILDTYGAGLTTVDCPGSTGTVIVKDSDVASIMDGGGEWIVLNSRVTGEASDGPEYIYPYTRIFTGSSGRVSIIGSTVEARATGVPPGNIGTIYLYGDASGGPELRIIGSSIVASNLTSSPMGVTAAIYEEPVAASGPTVLVEESSLGYQSGANVSSGAFYGVYSPDGTTTPIVIRASTIHSMGSGGTRADVYVDYGTSVSLAATQYSSTVGDGSLSTADLRQGKFSVDLVVPLTAPTLGPVDGQVWIDTSTNKLCYRSGSSTRCLMGS